MGGALWIVVWIAVVLNSAYIGWAINRAAGVDSGLAETACGCYDAIADVRTEIANTGLDIDRTEAHLEALQIVVYDRLRRIESALRTAEQ